MIEYSPAKTGEYPRLVYTKPVDSVEGARWLARQTPTPSNSEKMASRFASVTSEEIFQITFCGVNYLTVLVYIKTTIHISVGG